MKPIMGPRLGKSQLHPQQGLIQWGAPLVHCPLGARVDSTGPTAQRVLGSPQGPCRLHLSPPKQRDHRGGTLHHLTRVPLQHRVWGETGKRSFPPQKREHPKPSPGHASLSAIPVFLSVPRLPVLVSPASDCSLLLRWDPPGFAAVAYVVEWVRASENRGQSSSWRYEPGNISRVVLAGDWRVGE